MVGVTCRKNECFNTLYKVEVQQLLKGNAHIGDVLVVGETRNYEEIELGRKYLFFLQEMSDDFLKNCGAKQLLKSGVYADSPLFVGRYDILEDGNLSVVRCDKDLQVLDLGAERYKNGTFRC